MTDATALNVTDPSVGLAATLDSSGPSGPQGWGGTVVVLLTGGSGFIGRRIADCLRASGHELVFAVRDPSRLVRPNSPMSSVSEAALASGASASLDRCVIADLATDHREEDWLPRLRGVDAVVNAAGIFRESEGQTFAAVHNRGPAALFRACARAGIKRVVQISALGADNDAPTPFLRTKRDADEVLLQLPVSACVFQPSLVFGADGASTRLFVSMATWPVVPMPGGGAARVQPVHVDDLAEGVNQALTQPEAVGRVAAVGPDCLTLRDYLGELRRGILQRSGGAGRLRVLPLPGLVTRLVARVPALSGGWLDGDALSMLERDNCADCKAFAQLVGRPLRSPAGFVAPPEARALATDAQLDWLLPLLRLTLAIMWLTAGVVSLGVYPIAESLALLAAAGATGWFAYLLLYGAAAVDLLFGIGILVARRRRRLWQAQLAVILFYTAVITVALPAFWLHPYGPVVKNLPILAAILLVMALEER